MSIRALDQVVTDERVWRETAAALNAVPSVSVFLFPQYSSTFIFGYGVRFRLAFPRHDIIGQFVFETQRCLFEFP